MSDEDAWKREAERVTRETEEEVGSLDIEEARRRLSRYGEPDYSMVDPRCAFADTMPESEVRELLASKVAQRRLREERARQIDEERSEREIEWYSMKSDKEFAAWRAKRNAEARARRAEDRRRGYGVLKIQFRASEIRVDGGPSRYGRRRLSNYEAANLVQDVLNEIGLEINIETSSSGKTAEVTVTMPDNVDDPKRVRTRLAGRMEAPVDTSENGFPEINNDTTWRDYLEWSKERTPKERAAALGLSQSTYYRRLPKIRGIVEDDERRNEDRKRRGEPAQWTTVGGSSYTESVEMDQREDSENQ